MIYLAGPLFTTAQRTWNELLANNLRMKYEVRLPQEFCSFKMNAREMSLVCLTNITECDIIVLNCDGPDMDAGTAMEFGYALAIGKKSIAYRTDFRRTGDCDNNVNLMIGEQADAFVHRQMGGYSEIGRDVMGIIHRWENE